MGSILKYIHVSPKEWLNFVTNDNYKTIKPAHELRAMLEAAGVTPDKEVVTY